MLLILAELSQVGNQIRHLNSLTLPFVLPRLLPAASINWVQPPFFTRILHVVMQVKTCFLLATIGILYIGCTAAAAQEITKLQLVGTVTRDGPYSFPQKLTLDRFGNVYILDSVLSNVFLTRQSGRHTEVTPLCSQRTPVAAADLSVEGSGGGIWILASNGSRIVKLDKNCKVQKSFDSKRPALAIQVTTAGEIVVLTSSGEALFDVYDQNGALLRSFGRRISYGDALSDGELSNGRLAADRTGGFFFSFNYPPLVQHYARDGKLLGEFKPQSDVYIAPANVSSRKQGNLMAVRADYQILVLDMTLDNRGRLIFLISGKPKYQALTQGSQTLLVTGGRGTVLRKAKIDDVAFHRLAAGPNGLYLLRNREGLRLDKYQLP